MDTSHVFTQLSPVIQQRLADISISEPTAVQSKVIPELLAGKNLLFQSETGTGKTLAYLLPLIAILEKTENPRRAVRLVICAPTLELASQIRDATKTVTSLKTALLLGGAPVKRQLELLKEKPDIVIGNTARLLELARLKKLKLDGVVAAVFDEVDRLVKKEAVADLTALISLLPKTTQLIGCSATVTKQVHTFFAACESLVVPNEDVLQKRIEHWALYAESRDKIDTLRRLLVAAQPQKALVFTSRADQVENIASKLHYKKISCETLHAKASKQERKAAIDRFRSGKCRILITSDVAARGLDIRDISHIIQMDLPDDADFFVHRAGRTARAGKTGVNIVIGNVTEMRTYSALEKKLGITVFPKEIYNGKICAPES
ncbi:MAG: DEAD/DEAH box helicase [Treponema sp.]|nr:DEAD/DEAH box helicase [Treponema sp.]